MYHPSATIYNVNTTISNNRVNRYYTISIQPSGWISISISNFRMACQTGTTSHKYRVLCHYCIGTTYLVS